MTARKQRPRLEVRRGSSMSGYVNSDDSQPPSLDRVQIRIGSYVIRWSLKDAKRLHAFLGKAIAYLETRKPTRAASTRLEYSRKSAPVGKPGWARV